MMQVGKTPPGVHLKNPPGVFDPDEVLKSIASSNASDRPRRIEQLFIRLAVSNYEEALRKLAQVDSKLHPFALLPIVRVLAKTDLRRAKDIAEKMADGLPKAVAFAIVSVHCVLQKQKVWREQIQIQMGKMCERLKVDLGDWEEEYREADPRKYYGEREKFCEEEDSKEDLFGNPIKCYKEMVESLGVGDFTEAELKDWLDVTS